MYKYTDKVIRYMNRRTATLFERSRRLLRQDELNVIDGSKKLYSQLQSEAVDGLLRIAKDAYKKAHRRAVIVLGEDAEHTEHIVGKTWLADKLTDYDPITGYVFTHEVSRKRSRFAESVIAQHSNDNTKTAMRLWALMVAQYAIETTDNATEQAYIDSGVKYVRWNTEQDDKVCKTCKERNGKIYRISEVPDKPHWHCRCYLTPVSHKEWQRSHGK